MKFTGQRLEFCVACGGKLPEGSRIDRKYCRAACIERAYYQRHPDRKRVPGARRPQAQEVRAAVPGSEGQHAKADPSQALALQQAEREIAQLKQRLQAATEQASRFQRESAELRAQHQRGLHGQEGVFKKTQPVQTSGQLGEKAHSVATPVAAREPAYTALDVSNAATTAPVASAAAQLPQAPPAPAAPTSLPIPLPVVAPTLRTENLRRVSHPWETESSHAGSPPIAKWMNWHTSQLEQFRALYKKVLENIPSQMRSTGTRDEVRNMDRYIWAAHNAPICREFSYQMILRIGCTDETHRETDLQKEALATAALNDSIAALTREGYPQAADLRQEQSENSRFLFRLALELVRGCRGWSAKSQTPS